MDYFETYEDKPQVVFDATCTKCGHIEQVKFEIEFEAIIGWERYDRAMLDLGWRMEPGASDCFFCPNCK